MDRTSAWPWILGDSFLQSRGRMLSVTGCCADAIPDNPGPAPHDDGEEGVEEERVAAKPLLVAVAAFRDWRSIAAA